MNRVFEKKSDAEILALVNENVDAAWNYYYYELMEEINVVSGQDCYEEYARDLVAHSEYVFGILAETL